jgi:phosphohistidine phosphatase SixA
MKYVLLAVIVFMTACSPTRYYIVRHAEKAVLTKDSAGMMANNPPLSVAGEVRAFALREELKDKNIHFIYSTNTVRTLATAEPLSASRKKPIRVGYYKSIDSLVNFLKPLKGNFLVVGHSNTVDDIVNKLCGRTEVPGDLKDSDYDNLFIVEKKKGKMTFTRKKYGYPSNPE